jgi:CRP-like cAMP-binding protein
MLSRQPLQKSLIKNGILATMPDDAFAELSGILELTPVQRWAILMEQYRPIEHVYFVERGVASLLARTRRDGLVAVSLVGRFGFVGVSAVLGVTRSPRRCLIQTSGEAFRVPAVELVQVLDAFPQFRRQLIQYVHFLLVQESQSVLCNARHELEQRLSSWLLLTHDRLDGEIIPVTHDQMSMMLGVRRAGSHLRAR